MLTEERTTVYVYFKQKLAAFDDVQLQEYIKCDSFTCKIFMRVIYPRRNLPFLAWYS
jgi:hypothetical protein